MCCVVGVVVGGARDGQYQVQDANGAVETVPRQDIITDEDDAEQLMSVSGPGPCVDGGFTLAFTLTGGRHCDCSPPLLPSQLCSR